MPKSKFFRVCVEGATVDNREITRQEIADMAATYNPATYQARVNVEHFRGIIPGGPFDMLGDVTALKAQEDEIVIGGKPVKKLALYAQIDPLPALETLIKQGQKLHTSVEIIPNFAATGKAGLYGIAVTDSPASLGTEALKFSLTNPEAFSKPHRHQEGNLVSAAEETRIELASEGDGGSTGIVRAVQDGFAAIVAGLKSASSTVTPPPTTQSAGEVAAQPTEGAVDAFAAAIEKMGATVATSITALSNKVDALSADLSAASKRVETLEASAETTPSRNHNTRPASTGGSTAATTDC